MKKDIKYSYCNDENGNLIHIKSVSAENKAAHHFTCIECGKEMHARIGKGYNLTRCQARCDGETESAATD